MKNPSSFQNFNVNRFANLYHDKKGWMTSIIFYNMVENINVEIIKKDRLILLFVDNALSNKIGMTYSNVKIHLLPLNCTAQLQPLDMV